MTRKISCLLLSALACLVSTALPAQDKESRDRLMAAHALYYTPTASGLKSFRCDGNIDWKSMLTRFGGTEISDDNPVLKFLQSVHLSITDDLKDSGALEWTSAGDPPKDKEAAINQIQEGLKTSVSGFFQSWNAYMNGTMVPLPDSTVNVTKSGEGVHLSSVAKESQFDEDFDKNMLLTQVLVVTANVKILATPTYASTPDGLLVSAVTSEVSQPPTAQPAEAIFRIEYAKVDTFQIPSRIVFDIKNTGVIAIGLSACQASVADWAKKPSSH